MIPIGDSILIFNYIFRHNVSKKKSRSFISGFFTYLVINRLNNADNRA